MIIFYSISIMNGNSYCLAERAGFNGAVEGDVGEKWLIKGKSISV